MQRLYKREGRRFVPSEIQNNLGKYYDPINGFTTEKTDASVGLCIISDFEKDVIMELKDKDEILTENKRLPTTSELLLAFDKYQKELNLEKYKYYPVDNNMFTDKLGYAHGLLYLNDSIAVADADAADVHIGFRFNSIQCRIVRELKK